jgi:hypothetical protein
LKAARLQEAANNTTAQDDVRSMRTQPKTQQPTNTSRTKSFPSQTSEVIDLTLSDEVEEISHSKYALRSKTLGKSHERFLHQSWDEQSVQEKVQNQNEGDERWNLPQKPPVVINRLAQRQQQRLRDRNKSKEAMREQRRAPRLTTNTWSSDSAVMFTIPEAMAALARPELKRTIAYDLPTGDYLTYPVKRSYHLGAMGRYGNTRVAMHTSLPYRPSRVPKSSSRSNNRGSNYTKAHSRLA